MAWVWPWNWSDDLQIIAAQLDDIRARLARIETATNKLTKQGVEIMADLSGLTAQVKANTDVEASAITLLNGLAAQLAAAATDPAKVQDLANQLKTSADALAAAIVANTPAG